MFATFYSKNLNFYELVTKCTNIRIAVLKGAPKLERTLVRALRQMFGQRVRQINICLCLMCT